MTSATFAYLASEYVRLFCCCGVAGSMTTSPSASAMPVATVPGFDKVGVAQHGIGQRQLKQQLIVHDWSPEPMQQRQQARSALAVALITFATSSSSSSRLLPARTIYATREHAVLPHLVYTR